MSKIEAKIIADSKNEFGNRLTTFVVTFPRFILAELNTHRMFSRNSASSRAIPFEKMVKSVEENPFIPIAWQKDHKGMQGVEYIDIHQDLYGEVSCIEKEWLDARNYAVKQAKQLSEAGVTKQLCNRLLEPFMWHTVILSATEFSNFFSLRCPTYRYETADGLIYYKSKKDWIKAFEKTKPDEEVLKSIKQESDLSWLNKNDGQAEIHMMALAEAMWDALNESTPKLLQADEWHIPFNKKEDGQSLVNASLAPSDLFEHELEGTDDDSYTTNLKVKIATARCARVSYTVVGEENKTPNYENDIELHDNLLKSKHLSPFEHCAKAMTYGDTEISDTKAVNTGQSIEFNGGWSGNFRGFIQYRQLLT